MWLMKLYLELIYMDKKQKKTSPDEEKGQKPDKVVTPTPPQIIDPSASPGEGRNVEYGKGGNPGK